MNRKTYFIKQEINSIYLYAKERYFIYLFVFMRERRRGRSNFSEVVLKFETVN